MPRVSRTAEPTACPVRSATVTSMAVRRTSTPATWAQVRHDAVQARVRTPPVLAALAGHLDEPTFPEPLDQIGHGGPGQAGQRAELGSGQWPALDQQVQGEPIVDGAGHGRGRGLHTSHINQEACLIRLFIRKPA